ncbi:MAG: hypothetical protein QOE41_1900, partial [Mycobacterium sp.]|nr:hypothetical protein [Mycobacterium sp.]
NLASVEIVDKLAHYPLGHDVLQ